MVVHPNIIRTHSSSIWFDEDRILHVLPNEGAEIDLEEVIACFVIYKKLGCDKKKVLQLIDGRAGFIIRKEARDYAAKHGRTFFIASAVISNSLPVRLMVNFFNTFYNHSVPFKLFADEFEAITWLKRFNK